MERLSIENFIVDENELAEHYKEAGDEYGYKGKSKLVEYLKELKAYKEADEQGLLIKLPCKVGDTIYLVDFDENEYDEATVESIEFGRNGFLINSDCEIGTYLGAEYLFLTKEEAEQALKQMGE